MNEVFSGITRIVVYLSGAKGKKGAARRCLLKSSGRHDDVIEVSGPDSLAQRPSGGATWAQRWGVAQCEPPSPLTHIN